MFERISTVGRKAAEKIHTLRWKILALSAAAVFALSIKICGIKLMQLKQISFMQQKITRQTKKERLIKKQIKGKDDRYQNCLRLELEFEMQEGKESKPEEWYGTDRKLTDSEWEDMTQMILAEARGESFEVQYYIACVVLNRVDSDDFPDTVKDVIYQTDPVQFQGAWDPNWYPPTESVLEAIQAALEENRTPSKMYYFTSEGWLPQTKEWKQVGGMWFSCQE